MSNSAHGTHLHPFLLFMIIKILVSLWTDFIAVMNLKSMKMNKKLQPVYRTNYELRCLYIIVVFILVAVCGFVNKIIIIIIIYSLSLLSLSVIVIRYYYIYSK